MDDLEYNAAVQILEKITECIINNKFYLKIEKVNKNSN